MIEVPSRPSAYGGGSPYHLRVNGHWLPLPRVSFGSGLAAARPSSDMTTLDGTRHRWVAPAGARTWSVALERVTGPEATALRLACEFPDGVLLLDRELAGQNMLAPTACQGRGPTLLAGGVPLRRYDTGRTITTPVRAGVRTYVALWGDGATTPNVVGSASWPGGDGSLVAPPGTTAQRAVLEIVPDADGVLSVIPVLGTTGLQVTEDWLPAEWLPGGRTPCPVAVTDPERTLHTLGQLQHSRASYTVQLLEVGGAA